MFDGACPRTQHSKTGAQAQPPRYGPAGMLGITSSNEYLPGRISHGAEGTIMKSSIVKRSVVLAGRKTSVSLEDWNV